MHSILVKDYMDHNPHAINQNAKVRDVVESLINANIVGAPVIDDANHVVGFVSEHDCIKDMLNDTFFCDESQAVLTVMNRSVMTVAPDTSIVEIAEKMANSSHKHFPVVSRGKLVGLISRTRILRALLQTNEDCYLQHH